MMSRRPGPYIWRLDNEPLEVIDFSNNADSLRPGCHALSSIVTQRRRLNTLHRSRVLPAEVMPKRSHPQNRGSPHCYLLTCWETTKNFDVGYAELMDSQWQLERTSGGQLHVQMAIMVKRSMSYKRIKDIYGRCHIVDVPIEDWPKIKAYCYKTESKVPYRYVWKDDELQKEAIPIDEAPYAHDEKVSSEEGEKVVDVPEPPGRGSPRQDDGKVSL